MLALTWACNLPGANGARGPAATGIVETVSAMQTGLVASQTAAAGVVPPSATALPAALPSPTPAPLPTAADPVVSATALCWTGPGSAYPVVSSVKPGNAVKVLGVSSKVGWFVIENPTYGNRCWIEAKNLTLDPNFSTAGMQVFNPPPTPGPKVTPIPTPTT
jgi:uncharacterized protein YgiM (DUF1202 family)